MVWQALAGFGLGLGSNALNQMMSEGSNKRLQENQAKLNYQYAEKSAKNSPSWSRAGLESAGYNPMLAVQNATSGVNSSWASGAQTSTQDATASAGNLVANAQSYQRLKNETATANSTVKTNEATARNQNAEALNKETMNPYLSKQAEADIKRTNAEATKLNSDTQYNSAFIENLQSRLELDRVLGFAGLDVQRRGQNMVYNASKYSSDMNYKGTHYLGMVNELNNIRQLNSTEHSIGLGRFYNYKKRNSNWK